MITTVRGNAMVSRVPTRGACRMIGLLRLRGVSAPIAVNCGLPSGGVNGGNVVGITGGCFASRRVGHLSIITPGVKLDVVGSCRVIRGGAMRAPSALGNVMGYGGPGYVAGGRPVRALFRAMSGMLNVMHYRCYSGRRRLNGIRLYG